MYNLLPFDKHKKVNGKCEELVYRYSMYSRLTVKSINSAFITSNLSLYHNVCD